MLFEKDFVCRNLFGERFDKNIYRNGFELQHAKKAFDKLPEEYKLAVLEREIKRRYGLTLENLKKLN